MNNKSLIRFLSYALVAVMSAVITLSAVLFLGNGNGQSKLDQLEQIILNNFIGEADQQAMEDAAADAMIEALGDEWSYYMSAEEYAKRNEQQQNSYVGIGVTITPGEAETGLNIIQVAAEGPAEAAGILPGDRITGVDGQSILKMTTSEVQDMIKGEAGTEVVLTICRGEEMLTIPVIRAQVRTPVATAKFLGDGIGLITIKNFNVNCASETIEAIQKMQEAGANKLIFDLRFNPGGRVTELVKILDYLLPEGDLFRSEDVTGKTDVKTSDAACLELPMAVLVNGSSYSAAEFFAAAMREYDAATVVGEKTYGKGYYQLVYPLKDGSAVGLSIGKYYTPKGVSLAGVGITPDMVVPVDEETAFLIYAGTLDPSEDPQIQAAVQALMNS